MSVACFSPVHLVQVPSEGPSMDCLPTEVVEQICSWILADRKAVNGDPTVYPMRPEKWRELGHRTQFSRTLARLSLASKRYRQIALPYLYSYITVGQYDETQLPLFIYTLCSNPDLRPLVKKIDISGLPRDFIADAETMETPFNDAAAEFSLPPLKSWDIKECQVCRSKTIRYGWCEHFIRLMNLLYLLTPDLESLGKSNPGQACFVYVTDPTTKPAGLTSPCPPNHGHTFASLRHLWVAGGHIHSEICYGAMTQDITTQMIVWLVPGLRTLRARATCMSKPLPAYIQLDSLKEITLDTSLLTSQALTNLTSVCKVLESFNFHSRGNSLLFSDRSWNPFTGAIPNPFEFTPEDVVPAFSHLKGSLRHLAINRWDGARGGEDHNVTFTDENKEMYADWPNWIGNGKVIGSLKDFTVLETLKLDSTFLFHYSHTDQVPPALPAYHLTDRLPKSLRHLVLPGAPLQMVPALHKLAAASASKEFPALRLVEVTCDERDIQKREISIQQARPFKFLIDTASKFINIEEWNSLEQEFAIAGVKLVHIDSGNTGCFARDVLERAGRLQPVKVKKR
ncbi:hypothetical protein ACHAQJ_008492 [Trichoderma viride]